MKSFTLTLLGVLFTATTLFTQTTNDPVLMKINGNDVKLSEFEYIYNKNNTPNVVEKKTLKEYVDLFVNFRLKVEEALAQGLDTVPTFEKEYRNYVRQLSAPYLTDTATLSRLLEEAYYRSTHERNVSHILIRIDGKGTPADTLRAYQYADALAKRTTIEDFGRLALAESKDQSVQHNKGNIGWITAFRTPYEFETAVFSTPLGEVTRPVRTAYGYHIIRVDGERKSKGEIEVAHIMRFTKEGNKALNLAAKKTIDSIYNRLLQGDNFDTLATKLSDDAGSARNQGKLPRFGSGRMVPEFEEAAFALNKNNTLSKPIKTAYGWHIIKLIKKYPLQDFEAMKTGLEAKIQRDTRFVVVNQTLANRLKKEYHFTFDANALQEITQLADKTLPNDTLFRKELTQMNRHLFSFANQHYTQKTFGLYLANNFKNYRGILADLVDTKFNDFVDDKVILYEKSQLKNKYPEFHNLSQEYHDGILLFDISNKEVWDKATKDSVGLEKYFLAHKKRYKWEQPHYKGSVIFCKNKDTYNAAKLIVKNADREKLSRYLYERLNDSIQYVKVEKGLWKKGDNILIDSKIFNYGSYTPSEEYPYCLVVGDLQRKYPSNYKDVKGAVIADYQEYLEKEWVKTLRQRYPVIINEKVLETIKNNDK